MPKTYQLIPRSADEVTAHEFSDTHIIDFMTDINEREASIYVTPGGKLTLNVGCHEIENENIVVLDRNGDIDEVILSSQSLEEDYFIVEEY